MESARYSPEVYDYGEVSNLTVVKTLGYELSFNKLKPFYDNPEGTCHFKVRRFRDINRDSEKERKDSYVIVIHIDDEEFYETLIPYSGSSIDRSLSELEDEIEESGSD